MFNIKDGRWMNPPKTYSIGENSLEIVTEADTDLWQRTYYGFQHDNSPALLFDADYNFTFSDKCSFNCRGRFDQCGVLIYIDSDNWFKASLEYEDSKLSRLGSVVTNKGYSDWATSDVPTVGSISYRLSRRGPDFLIESALDGEGFKQMRIFHLHALGHSSLELSKLRFPPREAASVNFGLYACSPLEYSFKAEFSEIKLVDCIWEAHS